MKYKHLPFEEQEKNAKRIFQNWHERLRPAVDDKNRNMKFIWEIEFEKSKWPSWQFTHDPHKDAFEEILFEGPENENAKEKSPKKLYQ